MQVCIGEQFCVGLNKRQFSIQDDSIKKKNYIKGQGQVDVFTLRAVSALSEPQNPTVARQTVTQVLYDSAHRPETASYARLIALPVLATKLC